MNVKTDIVFSFFWFFHNSRTGFGCVPLSSLSAALLVDEALSVAVEPAGSVVATTRGSCKYAQIALQVC